MERDGVVKGNEGKAWKKLWQLKLSPKVKDFIWRAVWECIPTRGQLRVKRVDVPAICPVYHMRVESVAHCLLSCIFVHHCWSIADLGFSQDYEGFGDWFFSICDQLNANEWRRALTLCWELWKARNKVLWEGCKSSAAQVVSNAIFMFEQWRKAQDRILYPSIESWRMTEGSEFWLKPGRDTLKVNIDAAIFEKEGKYGFGGVIRDHMDCVVLVISGLREGGVTAEIAEGIASKEVLSWLKTQAPKLYQVETDCLVLVQAIRSPDLMMSAFGRIVQDCKELLKSWPVVDLVFVKRSANRVAHQIARASRLNADCIFSGQNVPPDIMYCVEADLA